MVSYFHFLRMAHPECFTWNEWFDNFRLDKMLYGGWINHVGGWWMEYGKSSHVTFLTYENMKKDIRATIQTLASFLEKSLSPQQVCTSHNWSYWTLAQ